MSNLLLQSFDIVSLPQYLCLRCWTRCSESKLLNFSTAAIVIWGSLWPHQSRLRTVLLSAEKKEWKSIEHHNDCSAIAPSDLLLLSVGEFESCETRILRDLSYLMGKLIKNHWARLIVLTAAACKHPPSNYFHQKTNPSLLRPNCCILGRLLLAENFLGLPDHEPWWRRAPRTHSASYKLALWRFRFGLGISLALARRHRDASQHRGSPRPIPCVQSYSVVIIPGHQSRHILSGGHRGLLLGV